MYKNLGVHWASSIPAFLALACVPFPFLFLRYGKAIRMRCKYAAEAAEVLQRMRANQMQQQQQQSGGAEDDEIDEDDAIAEADAHEAQQRREHELEKKATRTEGTALSSEGALAESSRNVSDDENVDGKEKN